MSAADIADAQANLKDTQNYLAELLANPNSSSGQIGAAQGEVEYAQKDLTTALNSAPAPSTTSASASVPSPNGVQTTSSSNGTASAKATEDGLGGATPSAPASATSSGTAGLTQSAQPAANSGTSANTNPNSSPLPPAIQSVVAPLAAQGVTFKNVNTNVLNDWDRYTYHFKLSLISDSDSNNPALLSLIKSNSLSRIIVAESGVTTGFALGDVTISDSVSANFRNRNTITTGIDFEIIEPFGTTLLDRLINASNALGIKNWRLAPMILELTLKGYDADGNIKNDGTNGIYKVYQLLITDFDASITEVGTKYKITSSVTGNTGVANWYYILMPTIKINLEQSKKTVGDIFQQLQDKINAYYLANAADPYALDLNYAVYSIGVCDVLAKEEIDFSRLSNARRQGYIDASSFELSVGRGTSIGSILDDILAGLADPNFFNPPENSSSQAVRVPRIEVVVKNLFWDNLTNDYVKFISYKVTCQDTIRVMRSAAVAQNLQEDTALQLARLKYISDNSLFRVYPYYYTGLNTEITNLAIEFNHLHVMSLPLETTTVKPSAGSSVLNPVQAEFNSNSSNLAKTTASLTSIYTSTESNPAAFDQIMSANDGKISSLQATKIVQETAKTKSRLDAFVSLTSDTTANAAVQSAMASSDALTKNGNVADQTAFDNFKKYVDQAATVISGDLTSLPISTADTVNSAVNAKTSSSTKYVEDYGLGTVAKSPATTNSQKFITKQDPIDLRNLLSRAGNSPITDKTAADSGRSNSIYTTIMGQLYERPGMQMVEIDMEIRGDPYWLGITNLDRELELQNFNTTGGVSQSSTVNSSGATVSSQTSSSALVNQKWGSSQQTAGGKFANFYDYDATFLLTFRSGVQPDDTTGFMNFSGNNFFNGIYVAIEVTHKFSGGKFLQSIKAVRDSTINTNLIQNSSTGGSSVSANNSTQPPQAPSVGNSVKAVTDRMAKDDSVSPAAVSANQAAAVVPPSSVTEMGAPPSITSAASVPPVAPPNVAPNVLQASVTNYQQQIDSYTASLTALSAQYSRAQAAGNTSLMQAIEAQSAGLTTNIGNTQAKLEGAQAQLTLSQQTSASTTSPQNAAPNTGNAIPVPFNAAPGLGF